MTFGDNWQKVIFSDEKKFNLDGPDGFKFYWHDLRKEPQYFSKRVCGGGSVNVWAGIGYPGKTELVFLDGRTNSVKYQNTLRTYLQPFAERISDRNWIFQQDNCPFHVSCTEELFCDRKY